MTDYVIDASVAVEYLLKTPVGLAMADTIDNASLVAPELIDAEVLSRFGEKCWAAGWKRQERG